MLWVYEGGVKLYNDKGSIRLSPGQGGQVTKGQAPQAKIDIKPQDAVSWSLYYPPVLPYPKATDVIDNDLRIAIQDFRQGHTNVALNKLEGLSKEKQNPYFYKVRAAMRLTIGQDKPALQDIQTILSINSNDADALALKSVLALTQNRKDEAFTLANKAVTANPQSASAYSALSYVEQGCFNLDKAQAAADLAAKLAPHDAMVWARKAELELSKGLTDESQKSAEKAIALDANLERTQTVLGFSYLIRMDTDTAQETFNKAIQFDSTSPLARLGLGLAKIRNGDLEQGREDLETAAILDPNNSIVRSYLGKAYYEERRSPLAEDQFKLAKERDPKDPTPYFYDAINKQTTNRPVEALQDMQKAIDLNDNRGVYRSSLALDKDLAARSAAQGRIYNDLGFSNRALVEGWSSVGIDPGNFSAHRFLADNYSALSRHQIARVSELLQSQLLQPINITPIQPRLAESNLLLLDGLGPSSSSFNEFNPLFQENGLSLQANSVAGSNNTLGDELVQSGIKDNFSYSLGQFHYETDGFRENNQLKDDIYTGFAQAKILPNLGVQLEARHRESRFGDLLLRFEPKGIPDIQNYLRTDTLRGGAHYVPSANVDLISSIVYFNNSRQDNADTDVRRNSVLGEGQAIFKQDFYNLIVGGGYLGSSSNSSGIHYTDNHGNAYLYANARLPQRFTWTLGASFDSYKVKAESANQISPKLGLIWKVTDDTTIRGAYFKTVKRPILNDQTIEPTNVAGFNQRYDDFNGTDSERYGIALDQRFNRNFYGGVEWSRRLLHVPQNESISEKLPAKERLVRAYFHWIPLEQVALNLNYEFENFVKSRGQFTKTHIVKGGIRFFHSSGITGQLQTTYVNQEQHVFNTGQDNFTLVDAALSYRLPKRYGIISFQINNMFDQHFLYQDDQFRSPQPAVQPRFFPERTFMAQLTLSFN